MSCERCGFTYYCERRPDGTETKRLGSTFWVVDNGHRTRLCLGCVADLRRAGHKVVLR